MIANLTKLSLCRNDESWSVPNAVLIVLLFLSCLMSSIVLADTKVQG